MNLFHLYVFISLFLITFLSVTFAIKKRKALTHMPSMVISMFLGMTIGFTAGLLFGSIYQGNLFLSTILGMLFGVVAGSLCGLVLGVLSLIEGFMAGLMGGMMGAMLGEMIPMSQASVMVQIFLTLSLCTIFLFFIFSYTKNPLLVIRRGLNIKLLFLSFRKCILMDLAQYFLRRICCRGFAGPYPSTSLDKNSII